MMKKRLASAALAAMMLGGAAMADSLPKTKLSVVGNLSFDPATISFEKPFWTETVPKLSDGQVTADFKSYNEMGLKGSEILRLMSQGVIAFGSSTLSYFAAENPLYDAINLVGVAPDIETETKVIKAFAPVYDKHFKERDIKVLGFGINPAQVLYCNAEIKGLADIKGKKVRISSRTQADFVDAIGGSSVNMAFAEVVPALQTKVVDCAITGTLPGYNAKWYEVSTHLLALPLNWNPPIFGVNLKAWEKLDPKVQSFISTNFDKMIEDLIEDVGKQNQEGYDCNTGADACKAPVKGKMVLVEPTPEDLELLKKIAYGPVVHKWAERCSAECVKDFNDTIAKSLGFTVTKE